MGKDISRCYPDGQQTSEKMLNITNHQGDANQNHNEMSPHTCQNGYYQKHKKQHVLERLWQKGNPCPLLVRIRTGAAILENGTEVP